MKRLRAFLLLIILLEILAIYFIFVDEFLSSSLKTNKKVFLIVIDAADWEVINPLIEQGELPNIKKLKETGSWGILKTYRSYSPIDWTSIATGKTEKKHNITNFAQGGHVVRSSDIKSKRIWNILNDYGITTGIYHYLFTWPPEEVDGFMISGEFSQNENITYPYNLTEILLADNVDIRNHEYNLSILLYLLSKYDLDFLCVGNRRIYFIQKFNWKYWKPEKFNITNKGKIERHRKKIIDAWKEMDNFLGKLMKYNATIIIASDHGLETYANRDYFYINFYPLFDNIFSLISHRRHPHFFTLKLRRERGYINKKSFYFMDNLSESESNQIIQLLREVKYGHTDKPFFISVSQLNGTSKDVFEVAYNVSSFRNLPESDNGYYYLSLQVSDHEVFHVPVYENSAVHTPETDGVIIVNGRNIKVNYKIKNAITYDITPTILYLYDLPVPKDMDGKVLTEMIEEDYLKNHPVKYTEESSQWEEKETKEVSNINETMIEGIKEKLRQLGYIV